MADDTIRVPVLDSTRPFVGIDASLSSTGFCLKLGSEIRVETIKSKPDDSSNDLERLKHITNEIMRRIPKDTKMVCMEDFFTPANPVMIGSAIKLAMLGTAIRLALYDAGFSFFIVAPTQLKLFVTGKGQGQKSIVVREVFRKWGIVVKDDNQADAAVLAHMAEALHGNQADLPKYQVELLGRIRTERPHYNCK